eukprot:4811080-Amphidinium_carterae.1
MRPTQEETIKRVVYFRLRAGWKRFGSASIYFQSDGATLCGIALTRMPRLAAKLTSQPIGSETSVTIHRP